jgi:hypothetical protein
MASSQQAILEAANGLTNIPRPNSDAHEILYEKAVHFGKRAIHIFSNVKKQLDLSDVEGLISEIGDVAFDQNDLDREYLIIAYELTSFGNLLSSFVVSALREREAQSESYETNQAEIKELTEAVSKLNAYIEEEVRLAKAESKLLRAAGMAEINLFIFSIPMQSVFNLIKHAKDELESANSINIRYVSALLTNANQIARTYWKKTKEVLARVPERIKSFATTVNLQTSTLASKAINLVIKSKIRKIRPRKTEFIRETTSYSLAAKRDLVIKYLLDFRRWKPKNVPAIFSSALYLLISDKMFFPHSEKILHEIYRDLVVLQAEEMNTVHDYVCAKAEALIEALSEAIRSTEMGK